MVWASSLENRPSVVKAIGMVSIEVGNLELSLADLMAASLMIPKRVAHAIYFTPRAQTLRVDILLEASKERFHVNNNLARNAEGKKRAIRKIEGICKRAKAAMEARNQIIHDAWGVSGKKQKGSVLRIAMRNNLVTDAKRVKLDDLKREITRLRDLVNESDELTKSLKAERPLLVDLRNNSRDAD